MMLLHPIWLLLVFPAAAAMLLWRMPSRLLMIIRGAVLALMILAACAPALMLPSRAGTVVVVADRSRSMPPTSETVQTEGINLIRSAMASDDRLAVIGFGGAAAIERSGQGGKFVGFVNKVDQDASDLAGALELAAAMIPRGTPGRILLLSDGRWTGADPLAAAAQAAARDIGIDFRCLQRPSANDVAVSRIDAPPTTSPGESFMLTAWIRCPVRQEVRYELTRGGGGGGKILYSGGSQMHSGLTRLTFRDTAGPPGVQRYTLRIVPKNQDPVTENNLAKVLVGVSGRKPMLCVTARRDSGLVRLLQAGKMDVKAAVPSECRWALEDLANYSSVLIENVPADEIGAAAMETLAAWVSGTGSGLMMTGGKNAYGPGGYFRSPLEEIMPVSMELRREHRKLAIAIAIALDRSGSMTAPAGGGKTKMDLANIAAAEVVKLLSNMDEVGVVAVDSSPHVIVNLAPLNDKASVRNKILKIDSMGGGIFVYEALKSASGMLLKAQAMTRHIILFADAADAEEPGKYKELLEKCRKAGITCSVIGLGTKGDCDATLLKDIAKRGGGRCFFTNKAAELPRLFAQDTFVVARSTFIDEPTRIRLTGALTALTAKQFSKPPLIGGYNLCYIRRGANPCAMSVDEYKAPIVASWQAGVGRVLTYTGQADGKFTGPIARWKDVGAFFTSLARWTAGGSGNLPDNMLLTQKVRGGLCSIRLHLDPEARALPFTSLPKVTTLRGLAGRKPATLKTTMQWIDPETLGLDFSLGGSETAISTVEVPGSQAVSLPPVCLPYSPEFRPVGPDKGRITLERLARSTGGTERMDLPEIWNSLPKKPRITEISHWLLLAAALILLLEILERRTGIVSTRGIALARLARRRRAARAKPDKTTADTDTTAAAIDVAKKTRRRKKKTQPSTPTESETPAPQPAESAPTDKPAQPEQTADILDAFRTAQRRAKGRTKRK